VIFHGFVGGADDVMLVHDDLLGFGLLAALQIGVIQEVHCVSLIVGFGLMGFGGARSSGLRRDVGGDGVLPHAEANENVRRHMDGMRRVGRDGGVTAGGGEALWREALLVRGVDDVVRNAGMARVLFEKRIEDGDGFLAELQSLDGVLFVSQRDEGERVKGADFDVTRKVGVPLFHRSRIRSDARFVFQLAVLKENCRCFNKTFFSWRDGFLLFCLIEFLASYFQALVVGKIPELMIERHRFAPVSHTAFRVLLRSFGECVFRLQILERMEKRGAFFDERLNGWRAGGGEIHFAEVIVRSGRRTSERRSKQTRSKKKASNKSFQGGGSPKGRGDSSAVSEVAVKNLRMGTRHFGGRLDAGLALRLQWMWSGTSKQVWVRKLFEPMQNL